MFRARQKAIRVTSLCRHQVAVVCGHAVQEPAIPSEPCSQQVALPRGNQAWPQSPPSWRHIGSRTGTTYDGTKASCWLPFPTESAPPPPLLQRSSGPEWARRFLIPTFYMEFWNRARSVLLLMGSVQRMCPGSSNLLLVLAELSCIPGPSFPKRLPAHLHDW